MRSARSRLSYAWYAPNYEVAEFYDLFYAVPNNSSETEVTGEVMAQIMYNLMVEQPYGPDIINFSNQELQAVKN